MLESCSPLEPGPVPLERALGRVTSAAVTAASDVPPFDNTAMDGFAVRAADTAGAPVELRVVGTVAAGSVSDRPVGPGEAVRIMTGAPIPAGADAVVMVERTSTRGDRVTIEARAAPGDHVRRAGDDVAAGAVVLDERTVLGPAHVGVLASLGQATVEVFPSCRVGVLSTGDELVEATDRRPLRPGQIRDSNRPTLIALLHQSGFEPVDLGLVGDDEAALTIAFEKAVAGCDAVITSGGVSVGDFDYVKGVLDRLGTMNWWQVAVKPARPLAFGVVEGKPVFGLPGNPVSSMVSFELFARPALRRMSGHLDFYRPEVMAVADEALSRPADGKVHFVRVVAEARDDGRYHVRRSGGQASHLLRAMALANALAVVPDGAGVAQGGTVRTMLLGSL